METGISETDFRFPVSNFKLRFEVADTGPGMMPEQMEKIFLPFEQIRNTGQWHEGTVAGLAITSHLIRLMGGEIKVKAELGKGSLFGFEVAVPIICGTRRENTPAAEKKILFPKQQK